MENNTTNPASPEEEKKTTSATGEFKIQRQLPNSTTVLVLGIISIATCWCWGVVGVTLGIIALVLSAKDKKLYKANPADFTESSYKNLNAGYICALIGTILSGLYLLFLLIYFFIIGAAISLTPWQNMI